MHKKLLMVLLPLLLAPCAWAQPKVVVSIKPVHALVAGVMEGVGTPELLLAGGESPHSYALRPSQARALAAAQLVFWVGPELETFLERPLRSLSGTARLVTLSQAQGLTLLPVRGGGAWAADHSHGHGHAHAPTGGIDGHLWLDPGNARAIVTLAQSELERLFPEERERLAANAARLLGRLEALEAELAQTLDAVREVPYLVFHDAYQYLEQRYGLNAVGAISLNPERSPGAQRVREVQRLIRERGARCVFAEPQFTPRLVATVVEGSGARQGVLDPLGAELPAGPEAYFRLMRALAENLRTCLEPDLP
ncbi:zinc ABC transporter substrate-binding protein [Geoalkalibacter sp.]|uniref:zinc ABC transporter substrate-binding protein n=1 Tax=Geoalkalibacter sp. TaxID=3041440 RepID=UPI00272E0458|nr:zinc ABC transporter substrate-binding protein [Geoalkalibacter sp.]